MRGAAIEYARAALAAPRDPFFRLTTGVALAALREVDRAAAQFQCAQSLAEDDVIAALLLQGALEEQGQTAQAQTVYLETVRHFARQGRPGLDASGSIARLRNAVARFPESAVAYLLLGDAYQVSEQWEDAVKAYAAAIALAPGWSKPHVNLGVLYLAQGRAGPAIAAFEKALAREPGNVQVQLLKGDAQAKLGLSHDALQTYRNVKNAPAVAADVSNRIGRVLLQNQQSDEAIRSFARARSLKPGDPASIAGIAEAQVQAGNYQAGAEAYTSALSLANSGGLLSTRPILYRGLAEAQLCARNPQGALETLQRALKDEPRSAPLWQRLAAQAYFAKGDGREGEDMLRRALDSEASSYPTDTLNAIAAQGLLANITAAYRAELSGPARPAALVALAHLARYGGDLKAEVSLLEQLAQARSFGADWFLLAGAYERAGRPVEARNAYRQALARGGLSRSAAEYVRYRLKARLIKKP